MTKPVLLLADLHLPDTASPLRQAFKAFLLGPARSASAVYILGDLFEYWIGDEEGLRDYADEAGAIRALVDCGVPVYFMDGNRDFLVAGRFARDSGIVKIDDPFLVDIGDVPTLLSHGDGWCTDDLPYQRWRRFSRNRIVQALFRPLPERLRQYVAGNARGRSEMDKRNKAEAIMDVNPSEITGALIKAGVRRMIHGHTHRPAEHAVILPDGIAQRIVLADWRPGLHEYLKVDSSGCERRTIDVESSGSRHA